MSHAETLIQDANRNRRHLPGLAIACLKDAIAKGAPFYKGATPYTPAEIAALKSALATFC